MTNYLLGHDASELERLTLQHALWAPTLLDSLRIQSTDRVLEVGCGGGDLLADLAALSPSTRGLERDASAAAHAARVAGVPVDVGDLYEVHIPGGMDWIVVRWVLSFVGDLDGAVARLAASLAPGGRLVVQDYNHEGLSIFPADPDVWRVIEAFRAAYTRTGGDLWVAGKVPAAMGRAGLEVEAVAPHAKAGGPGSPTWLWVERFLHGHVGTLVDAGDLTEAERDGFIAAWARLRETPGAMLFSPLVVTVTGRR